LNPEKENKKSALFENTKIMENGKRKGIFNRFNAGIIR